LDSAYNKEEYKMAVTNVERKITRIGNSLGITLPQEVLNHLNVKQGDEIKLLLEEDGTVSFKRQEKLNYEALQGIDQDFLDGVKDLFDNYDQTLKNLVDR
jgi:antitoxin MazE